MAKCCKPCASIYIIFCVVANAMVFVVLGVALYLRFYHLSPISHKDMPSDSRTMVHDPSSSVFCKEHNVVPYLIYPSNGDFVLTRQIPPMSQTLLDFDALILDHAEYEKIKKRPLIERNINNLKGYNGLQPGQYIYHPFHVRNKSEIDVGFCFNYCNRIYGIYGEITCEEIDTNATFAVYLLKGQEVFENMESDFTGGTDLPVCKNPKICIRKVYPATVGKCPTVASFSNMTHHMKGSSGGNNNFYFIYFFPQNTKPQTPIKFKLFYNISSYVFNISGYESRIKKKQETIKTYGTRPIALEFNYYGDSNEQPLYAVQVDYSCSPDILVYMGVFFFMPIGLLVLLFFLLRCCCIMHADDRLVQVKPHTTSYESITDYSA